MVSTHVLYILRNTIHNSLADASGLTGITTVDCETVKALKDILLILLNLQGNLSRAVAVGTKFNPVTSKNQPHGHMARRLEG